MNQELSVKKLFSNSRNFLMGFAIIFIAIYHIPLHPSGNIPYFIKDIGYIGADMFILLSGFGAWHSLEKDDDAFGFFIRRLKRILPSYLPYIVVWMIVHKILLRLYFTEVCGNLTMLGWWNGDENQLNWYIDCIIVFYILAPYIYKAICTYKNRLLTVCILLIISLLIGVSFMHGQQIIAISRLPLFIMGFAFASVSGRLTEGRFSIIFWNLLMIIGIIAMYVLMHQTVIELWHYGMYWYPMVLVVPGLCMDLALFRSLLCKTQFSSYISGFFEELGKASFELFLIHLFIFENFMLISTTSIWGWLGMLVISFILGYGYYRLVQFLRSKIDFIR